MARSATIGTYENRVSPKPLTNFQQGAASIQAGLAAAAPSGGDGPYDATEAAVSIGSQTAAGALAGAAAGGPIGALIGGGSALLLSSVNAWMGVRASRRRRRALEQLRNEARAREAREAAQADRDKAHANRLAALQGASVAYDKNAAALQAMMVQNENLRDLYIQRGY